MCCEFLIMLPIVQCTHVHVCMAIYLQYDQYMYMKVLSRVSTAEKFLFLENTPRKLCVEHGILR